MRGTAPPDSSPRAGKGDISCTSTFPRGANPRGVPWKWFALCNAFQRRRQLCCAGCNVRRRAPAGFRSRAISARQRLRGAAVWIFQDDAALHLGETAHRSMRNPAGPIWGARFLGGTQTVRADLAASRSSQWFSDLRSRPEAAFNAGSGSAILAFQLIHPGGRRITALGGYRHLANSPGRSGFISRRICRKSGTSIAPWIAGGRVYDFNPLRLAQCRAMARKGLKS